VQDRGKGILVIRGRKKRGVTPSLPQAGNIPQHKSATGQGGFDRSESKGLIAGRHRKDCSLA